MTSLTSAPPAPRPSPDRAPRSRLWFWRSPAGQPPWARPALLGIAGLAALLYTWNITSSGFAPYYSVAARSMSVSWKAFLFTSLDPSATLTLDKIGGFLWPQALSARIFGFHDWALALPQCVMGVISVLVMYRLVRRWQGPAAGLLAAGLLTVTPVAASMFGHAMLDGSVTMCLVLAADQYQKAVGSARLRSLLLSALWIGLGFQAKMMEAWIVVPALCTGYLVAAPVRLRRRIGQLALAGAVMLSVSLSWVALMTFTPERDRPYADGSTDNSAAAMVFGYNGFNRLHAGLVDGAAPVSGNGLWGNGGPTRPPSSHTPSTRTPPTTGDSTGTGPDGAGRDRRGATPAPGPAPRPSGGPSQGQSADAATAGSRIGPKSPSRADLWLKLLRSPRLTPQIAWLYPLALISLVMGLVRHRKASRTHPGRAGHLMWGTWLVTAAAVLSALGNLPHTAYVAVLAPPLVALSAAGTVTLWRSHRAAARGTARVWVLPAVVVVETAWTVRLAAQHADFAPWLVPLLVAAALAAVVALSTGKARRRVALGGLLAACVAMFAAPTTWSLSVLDERYGGSAVDAYAGPGNDTRISTGKRTVRAADVRVRTSPTKEQSRLLGYVEKRDGAAKYTLSTETWEASAPYVYAAGTPVLPLGGLHAEPVTLAEYRHLVATGDLRFALVTGEGTRTSKISAWVASACAGVDPRAYGATGGSNSKNPKTPKTPRAPAQTLYRCEPSDATSR
ncbi:glycosyltransferase family 39 protein [Streptomyces atriruber]|uniref:glycosyltransferase family 39 protein n=1 Tax=Streptomyces atriruber TaxID=545121 RepID=UPI0006E354C9|nr:glycosyltransferase family 39 protein [Streptomyces atriruber]